MIKKENIYITSITNNIKSEKHITSVMTFADFYLPKVALAAEYLGLPCMSYKTAIRRNFQTLFY